MKTKVGHWIGTTSRDPNVRPTMQCTLCGFEIEFPSQDAIVQKALNADSAEEFFAAVHRQVFEYGDNCNMQMHEHDAKHHARIWMDEQTREFRTNLHMMLHTRFSWCLKHFQYPDTSVRK